MCILDVCLRNDNGQLIWAISDFVQSTPNDLPKVSYDYEGQGLLIRVKDDQRTLTMVIDKVRYLY